MVPSVPPIVVNRIVRFRPKRSDSFPANRLAMARPSIEVIRMKKLAELKSNGDVLGKDSGDRSGLAMIA